MAAFGHAFKVTTNSSLFKVSLSYLAYDTSDIYYILTYYYPVWHCPNTRSNAKNVPRWIKKKRGGGGVSVLQHNVFCTVMVYYGRVINFYCDANVFPWTRLLIFSFFRNLRLKFKKNHNPLKKNKIGLNFC